VGYDKYNIDWSVYGSQSSAAGANSGNPMEGSIGQGWSAQSNIAQTQEEETADTQPENNTIRITSAKFTSDTDTAFLKECKIEIETQGNPAVAEVALWGTYDGTDYDLHLTKKVDFSNNLAQSMLTLEYVEEFYNEYYGNENISAFVDYFFMVTCKGAVKKKSDLLRMPISQLLQCDFVEMPDVLFHLNSAVPCLDSDGVLIGALIAAFIFSKENTDKEIVLFGHADTSGDPSYNYDLSGWRAESIKALMDGDVEAWINAIDHASKVEDYQTILKTLSSTHGWDCDPGEIDNISGEKTTAAIKAFQEKYKSDFSASDDFKIDGVIGPKTWKALFEVIHSIVVTAIKEEIGEELPVLTYGYEGKGIYPCGESIPIDKIGKDNYVSAKNRRVEIVFYDKGKAPGLVSPADTTDITTDEVPIYDTTKTDLKPVPKKKYTPPDVPVDDKLVFYNPATDEYIEFAGSEGYAFMADHTAVADDIVNALHAAWRDPDFENQCKKSTVAKEKLETLLGSKTQVSAKDVFDELLLCRRDKNKKWLKPVVYVSRNNLRDRIRSQQNVKAFARSAYDEAKELAEFHRIDENVDTPEKRKDPLFAVKANFWKAKGADKSVWKFTTRDKNGKSDVLDSDDHFSLSAEAQFLRFAAGAGVSADITSLVRGEPKFSLGVQGNITLSLAEGNAQGSYSFPSKKGYNLLEFFSSNDKLKEFVKNGRACNVLFKIGFESYAFVGVTAQAFLDLPKIDFSQIKPAERAAAGASSRRNMEANAGAGGSVAATATAGGAIAASVEWKGHDTAKFEALGEIKAGGEVSAGIGISFTAQAGLIEGKFKIVLKAGLVVGIGGKLNNEISVGVDQGYKFVAYILRSFDYHYAKEIFKDAFDACKRIAIAGITDVAEVANDVVSNEFDIVKSAFKWGERLGRKVKSTMVATINSGAKTEAIKDSVPEASGALICGIMDLPEEDDFDAILAFLNPAGEHEIKSILRVIGKEKFTGTIPGYDSQTYSTWQGEMLKAGAKRLMEFGPDLDKTKRSTYLNVLEGVWGKHGILF
jgi:outer membrane protein OmpA-like peptidoglycan-associated protein